MPSNAKLDDLPIAIARDDTKKIVRIALTSDTQIGTTGKPAELHVTGRTSFASRNVNSSIVFNDNDFWISFVDRSTSITCSLPTDPRIGQVMILKDESGQAAQYPVKIFSLSYIDGQKFFTISSSYSSLGVQWSGKKWNTFGVGGLGGGGGGVGPAGPTGSQGPAGPTGSQGPAGSSGMMQTSRLWLLANAVNTNVSGSKQSLGTTKWAPQDFNFVDAQLTTEDDDSLTTEGGDDLAAASPRVVYACYTLETTSEFQPAQADLFDIDGIFAYPPAVIPGSTVAVDSLVPSQTFVDLTSQFASVTGSGVIEARLWMGASGSTGVEHFVCCREIYIDVRPALCLENTLEILSNTCPRCLLLAAQFC